MADCGWGQTVGHLEGSTCVCNATYRDDETVFKMNNCAMPWPIETSLCAVWSAWCFVEMVWHLPKLRHYARLASKSWWGTLEDATERTILENEAETGKMAAHLTFIPVALFSLFVGLRSSGAMDTFVPYRVMRGVLELWLALVTHSAIADPSTPFTAFTTANAVLITVTTVLSAIEHLETEHAMWWGIAQTLAEWWAIWWFRIELKRVKSKQRTEYDRNPTYGVTPEQIPAYLVVLQTIRTVGYLIAVIVYNASVTRPLFIVWIVTQNAFLYELFLASDYRARASVAATNDHPRHAPLIQYEIPEKAARPNVIKRIAQRVLPARNNRIAPDDAVAEKALKETAEALREQALERQRRAEELQRKREAYEGALEVEAARMRKMEAEMREEASARKHKDDRARILEQRKLAASMEKERLARLNKEEEDNENGFQNKLREFERGRGEVKRKNAG